MESKEDWEQFARSIKGWTEIKDIPTLPVVISMSAQELGRPVVVRLKDGSWWIHPGLPKIEEI